MTGEEIKEQVFDAVACDDMFYRPELRDAIYDMVDENEKLRELLKDALPLIWLGNVDCSGCLHMCECYAGEATDYAPENCRLIVRAKELGIEVDE